MVLNPPQVEAHLRFRALLEDCHFSSLRAPREAGFGAPCLARVCLGQTQKLFCLPLFPGGQGVLEGVSLLGPPESWSTEGAVLFSARKWQYDREWISLFKGRRPRVGLAELPQEDSALSFSWSEWHPKHVATNMYVWGGDRWEKKQIALLRCPCISGFLCSHMVWMLLRPYVHKHTLSEQCRFEGIASCSEETACLYWQNVHLFVSLCIPFGSYNQSILMPATLAYTWLRGSGLANWTRPGHFKIDLCSAGYMYYVLVSYVLVSQINAVCSVKSV